MLGLDYYETISNYSPKITSCSLLLKVKGSFLCQTFLPTAPPAPPAASTSLTLFKNSSSVLVVGPPGRTTLVGAADSHTQRKLSRLPVYLTFTMSAPSSSPIL